MHTYDMCECDMCVCECGLTYPSYFPVAVDPARLLPVAVFELLGDPFEAR